MNAMSSPLLLRTLFERAVQYFPHNEIVSREDDNVFRYRYKDFGLRVRRLGHALEALGVRRGERVATLAWNHYRHLELYFAVPSYGAVLHTVNLRLGDEDLVYIVNHAEDAVVFVDLDLLPVVERLAPRLRSVRAYVVLDSVLPSTRLRPVFAYEQLLEGSRSDYAFPTVDENAPAGMCYTSATTGRPKGVVYTQRSLYLHTLTLGLADVLAVSEYDTILPVVPMFHVNSWGLPFAGVTMGSKLVLPGVRPRPEDLLRLIESERVTLAAAAVTVGIDMLKVLAEHPYDISSLRYLMLGGQATPQAVMEQYWLRYGVPIFTAWGATETSPIATCAHVPRHRLTEGVEGRIAVHVRQGRVVPGLELRVVDDNGQDVPWDDRTMGEVWVRGPWVAREYYRDLRSRESFGDGWWHSGDIATIDGDGILRLVDRKKDLIKSGGEWISSVDLENELMAHPDVAEACVVAVPHEKWLERPVACVVLRGTSRDEESAAAELRAWLANKFPKWWLPDRFLFMHEIPRTGAGKFNKRRLREELRSLAHEW